MTPQHIENLSPEDLREIGRRWGVPSDTPTARLLPETIRAIARVWPHDLNKPTPPVLEPSGWIVDPTNNDISWMDPRLSGPVIITPAREKIPLVPGLNTDSQQLTYILILCTQYSNAWVDVTKVFNRIWNGPSVVVSTTLSVGLAFTGPYPELSQQELEKLWSEQTLYPTDAQRRKVALAALMAREDIFVTLRNVEGGIHFRSGKAKELTDHIEQCAKEVKVELKEV